MLPDFTLFGPKLQEFSTEEVRALQTRKLKAQVNHCYEDTPFWRRKFETAGISPDDIRSLDDLHKIPFCTKQELLKDQEENPPFGSYLGVHPSRLSVFNSTSGTTGRPLKRVHTKRDWNYMIERFVRNPIVGPGDVVMILGPTDSLQAPSISMSAFSAMGALVVRASRFGTEDKIKLIHELKPTLIVSTTSFFLYLTEVAAKMEMPFTKMGGVRYLSSVGEPGGSIESVKKKILKEWGAEKIMDGYGMTELIQTAGGCPKSTSLHIHDEFVIAEVVDPKTGHVLEPDTGGELVLTNILSETQPLLRYRTGDLAGLARFSPCPACGYKSNSILNGIEGRSDDMIWYKGINIFPSAIETVVRSFDVLSDAFEIVLDQKGTLQSLTVRAEVKPQIEKSTYETISRQLSDKLRSALEGVHAGVELLQIGALPKTMGETGKARRVRDNRPKAST